MNRSLLNLLGLTSIALISFGLATAIPASSAGSADDEDMPPPPVTQTAAPVVVPATTRSAALQQAKSTVGKRNPFAPISEYKPFPAGTDLLRPGQKAKLPKPGNIIPAPPPQTLAVPPPPELGETATTKQPPQDLLSPGELPVPPEKPSLSPKLQLCGILGNRALFTFSDQLERIQNKWPACISLATGEQFESVSVIEITPDTVTIEEDGEREVKQLQRIR